MEDWVPRKREDEDEDQIHLEREDWCHLGRMTMKAFNVDCDKDGGVLTGSRFG